MSELILFVLLLGLGFACYGIFFWSIKWLDKI